MNEAQREALMRAIHSFEGHCYADTSVAIPWDGLSPKRMERLGRFADHLWTNAIEGFL